MRTLACGAGCTGIRVALIRFNSLTCDLRQYREEGVAYI